MYERDKYNNITRGAVEYGYWENINRMQRQEQERIQLELERRKQEERDKKAMELEKRRKEAVEKANLSNSQNKAHSSKSTHYS